MDAFNSCLPIILIEEGGFSNDPLDNGGITNLGITKAVWDRWTNHTSTIADMRALTPALVAPLYRANYWQAAACDKLPQALALCVFDFAVNGGVGRASRYLQRMAGATDDGQIGPGTLAAVQQFVTAHGIPGTVDAYQNARIGFYRSLSTFDHFGKGWLNRVEFIRTKAKGL